MIDKKATARLAAMVKSIEAIRRDIEDRAAPPDAMLDGLSDRNILRFMMGSLGKYATALQALDECPDHNCTERQTKTRIKARDTASEHFDSLVHDYKNRRLLTEDDKLVKYTVFESKVNTSKKKPAVKTPAAKKPVAAKKSAAKKAVATKKSLKKAA